MARPNRKDIVDPDQPGFYHCYSRCVRRAFLCGFDNETGECFDHRKDWIEERQEFLEQIFAIELTGYGIMDNHMHHILYTRPDLAQEWTDREVVERWWRLHPQKKTKDGLPAELTDEKLLELLADRERVAKWRARLSSLSWYMKELKEDIARRANAEDDTRGHFWEARFKSPQLLDIVTLLICLLYVDLNPIRAGKATNAENAFHTSAHRRFRARELRARRVVVVILWHGWRPMLLLNRFAIAVRNIIDLHQRRVRQMMASCR